jgi:hypothetical protein
MSAATVAPIPAVVTAIPVPAAVTEPDNAALPAAGARPTAEQIDQLAAKYNLADTVCGEADKVFKVIEKEAIDLVTAWGVAPPKAESSRRLEGKLAKLTVTRGNSLAIDESRVEDLRQALVANDRAEFFAKLFEPRVKHELIAGADVALKVETMSKRLTEKVLALFGRCFTAKKKAPSLKVDLLNPVKKPRKAKAAKGAA